MLDVSLRAGVSKATVSRVLNGTGQVKEYAPAGIQSDGRAGLPQTFSRLLTRPATALVWWSRPSTALFWPPSTTGFAADETHGKQLIVTDGHDAPEREEQAVQMLADRQCDAIVLYALHERKSDRR
jgi:ABC-type sugar transport system substrate-binding protein